MSMRKHRDDSGLNEKIRHLCLLCRDDFSLIRLISGIAAQVNWEESAYVVAFHNNLNLSLQSKYNVSNFQYLN